MSSPDIPDLPAADFFAVESMLGQAERNKLAELRDFLAADVAPYAGDWWNKAEFPAHILPKLAALELSTPAHRGNSNLFAGLVIAEMTRVDTSLATFFLVHHDLFVESLHAFGSPDQKRRLLADASNLRITGAFALTEPLHGSDVAGGMETRARRISSGTGSSGRSVTIAITAYIGWSDYHRWCIDVGQQGHSSIFTAVGIGDHQTVQSHTQ